MACFQQIYKRYALTLKIRELKRYGNQIKQGRYNRQRNTYKTIITRCVSLSSHELTSFQFITD